MMEGSQIALPVAVKRPKLLIVRRILREKFIRLLYKIVICNKLF